MQESSVYEHLVETADEERYQRGVQHGARQNALEFLFVVLEFRFDGSAVQVLKPAIESIQNLQYLQELYSKALRAETLEAFVHTLGMNSEEQ